MAFTQASKMDGEFVGGLEGRAKRMPFKPGIVGKHPCVGCVLPFQLRDTVSKGPSGQRPKVVGRPQISSAAIGDLIVLEGADSHQIDNGAADLIAQLRWDHAYGFPFRRPPSANAWVRTCGAPTKAANEGLDRGKYGHEGSRSRSAARIEICCLEVGRGAVPQPALCGEEGLRSLSGCLVFLGALAGG